MGDMPEVDLRALDRNEDAHVIHFGGAFTVQAGMYRLPDPIPFYDAHVIAAVHNEARINQRFAESLRVDSTI